MSNPHSLPSNSQRIATQLPFSPSPSTTHPTIQRLQSQSRMRSGSTSEKPQHTRSGSVTSALSRTQNALGAAEQVSSPPPVPLYQPPRQGAISPSATGIQPSAGFFHPQRPNHGSYSPTPWARPSSPGSIVSSDVHSAVPVHLAPFTRQETETDGTESIGISSTEDLHHSPRLPPKSTKHSREPLLPIGVSRPRGSTVTSPRPPHLSIGPYGRSESSLSAGARVRGSFEKLFKRGLSFEGGKRTSPVLVNGSLQSHDDGASSPTNCMPRTSRQTSPVTPSGNGHQAFDLTARNDDLMPTSPVSVSGFKHDGTPRHASTPLLHELSFDPVPPADMNPPLAFTPQIDEKTGKPRRNYQNHPSRNRFFLRGHVLTGGDTPWAFVASLTVVLGITGVWFGTTCVWWWLHESPAVAGVGAYMCLLTISSMFATVSSRRFSQAQRTVLIAYRPSATRGSYREGSIPIHPRPVRTLTRAFGSRCQET